MVLFHNFEAFKSAGVDKMVTLRQGREIISVLGMHPSFRRLLVRIDERKFKTEEEEHTVAPLE